MTSAQFAEWAQKKMDSCNVFDEIETSKTMVEIYKKYFSQELRDQEEN